MSEHDVDPRQLEALVSLKAEMVGELHDDLKPYLMPGPLGLMLKHPLVNDILVIPGMHGQSNRLYERRQQILAETRKRRQWLRYVFTHERPWRATALEQLVDDGSVGLTKQAEWHLASVVWTDSENVEEFDGFWSSIWSHDNARMAMNATERKAFEALPEMVPVWHGLEREDGRTLGFSWTTSEKVGRWFASRFAMYRKRGSYLAKGLVPKSKVRAYLLGRNEFEIIAFPEDVEQVVIKRVFKGARDEQGFAWNPNQSE